MKRRRTRPARAVRSCDGDGGPLEITGSNTGDEQSFHEFAPQSQADLLTVLLGRVDLDPAGTVTPCGLISVGVIGAVSQGLRVLPGTLGQVRRRRWRHRVRQHPSSSATGCPGREVNLTSVALWQTCPTRLVPGSFPAPLDDVVRAEAGVL